MQLPTPTRLSTQGPAVPQAAHRVSCSDTEEATKDHAGFNRGDSALGSGCTCEKKGEEEGPWVKEAEGGKGEAGAECRGE